MHYKVLPMKKKREKPDKEPWNNMPVHKSRHYQYSWKRSMKGIFLYDTAKIYLKLQQLKRYGSGIGVNTCTKKIKDSRNGHFNIWKHGIQ